MRIAGEDDMRGAHAPVRGGHALANARRIDRQSRRVLENPRSSRFRSGGQSQRVIERVDMESVGKMNRMKVAPRLELRSDELRRPEIDVHPQSIAQQRGFGRA